MRNSSLTYFQGSIRRSRLNVIDSAFMKCDKLCLGEVPLATLIKEWKVNQYPEIKNGDEPEV